MNPEDSDSKEYRRTEILQLIDDAFGRVDSQLQREKKRLIKHVDRMLDMSPDELGKLEGRETLITDMRTLLFSTKRTNNQPGARSVIVSDAAMRIIEEMHDSKEQRSEPWAIKEKIPRNRKGYSILGILAEAMTANGGVVQLEEFTRRTGFSERSILSAMPRVKHTATRSKYQVEGNCRTGWRLVAKDS